MRKEMSKVVITPEMLEDAKTCLKRDNCDGCKMFSIRLSLKEGTCGCIDALAAALDEERKLYGDIIAKAPLKADCCRVLIRTEYFDKDMVCLELSDYITLPGKSPEEIIIGKYRDHARELLDEYKELLDAILTAEPEPCGDAYREAKKFVWKLRDAESYDEEAEMIVERDRMKASQIADKRTKELQAQMEKYRLALVDIAKRREMRESTSLMTTEGKPIVPHIMNAADMQRRADEALASTGPVQVVEMPGEADYDIKGKSRGSLNV